MTIALIAAIIALAGVSVVLVVKTRHITTYRKGLNEDLETCGKYIQAIGQYLSVGSSEEKGQLRAEFPLDLMQTLRQIDTSEAYADDDARNLARTRCVTNARIEYRARYSALNETRDRFERAGL